MSHDRRAHKSMMITSYFLGDLNKIVSLKISLNSIFSFPVAFMVPFVDTNTTWPNFSKEKLNRFSCYLTCLLKHFSTHFQLLQLTYRKTKKHPNFVFFYFKLSKKNLIHFNGASIATLSRLRNRNRASHIRQWHRLCA